MGVSIRTLKLWCLYDNLLLLNTSLIELGIAAYVLTFRKFSTLPRLRLIVVEYHKLSDLTSKMVDNCSFDLEKANNGK